MSLRITAGERVCLLGPSGSGKTTLLRIVAGLEEPSGGRLNLDGQPANQLPTHLRGVAYLSQRPSLYPHWDVRRNLQFGLPRDRHPQELERIIQVLGLANLLERTPQQLSGGQRQRVALGRALARRARILLLDEPAAALEGQQRLLLRRELALLHQEFAPTIIAVTHDAAEAASLAERVVVLDRGTVAQCGAYTELLQAPCSSTVATTIAWPPMNLSSGRLSSEGGGHLVVDGLTLTLPPQTPLPCRDGPVLIGIRPEHLALTNQKGLGMVSGVQVRRLEWLGTAWLAEVGPLGWLVGPLSPPAPPLGQEVALAVQGPHICWFDPATGRALPRRVANG